MQRYLFFLGGGAPNDRDRFEAMFQGLRSAWAEDGSQLDSYQTWKDEALKRWAEDAQLMDLLRRQVDSNVPGSTV